MKILLTILGMGLVLGLCGWKLDKWINKNQQEIDNGDE